MRTAAAAVPVRSCTAVETAMADSIIMTGAVKLSVIIRLIRHMSSIASLSISLFNLTPPLYVVES